MPKANKLPGYDYRSKLGPIPPDDWDNEPRFNPDVKEDTSPGSLHDKIKQLADKARAAKERAGK